jgi:hypothetical protein
MMTGNPRIAALLAAWSLTCLRAGISEPAIRVDVANPTQDKPQSKIWYAQGSWWAWLAVRGGSGVWKRTSAGWRRETALDGPLQGLPGQADVWSGGNAVGAVLVEPKRLAFVLLKWDRQTASYRLGAEPARFAMPDEAGKPDLETATIARDARGRWWIAYGWRRRVWVRVSRDRDGTQWHPPAVISPHEIHEDDICAAAALPGGVGVIWSDQNREAVYFRLLRGPNPSSWRPVETAAQGGKTADDHFNLAVAADGALWAATKNSVDQAGQPQLVLRKRSPRGEWSDLPYGPRTLTEEPTRPIVLLSERPPGLWLAHTVHLRDRAHPRSLIVWQQGDPHRARLSPARPLLEGTGRLNNVTGAKAALPDDGPWLVLASDAEGNVFEADLRGVAP